MLHLADDAVPFAYHSKIFQNNISNSGSNKNPCTNVTTYNYFTIYGSNLCNLIFITSGNLIRYYNLSLHLYLHNTLCTNKSIKIRATT